MQNAFLSFVFLCGLEVVMGTTFECPLNGITMTREDDDNYYRKYENVDSHPLCGIFCARSERCNYWTWFQKNSHKHDELDCLLFESNDQMLQNDGAISGENNCPANLEPEPTCPSCGVIPIDFTAKNLDYITFDNGLKQNYIDEIPGVGDSKLCGDLCAITAACAYWTWYKAGAKADTCLMFNNIEQLQYNTDAYSGNKYYPDSTPEPGCQPPCSDVKPEPGPDNAANALLTIEKGLLKWIATALCVVFISTIWK